MPCRWAWSSALAISIARHSAMSSGNGPFASRAATVSPSDNLHHDVVDPVMTTDVVQRADMRMGECRNRSGFASKPRPLRFEREMRRKNLDRHGAIEADVGGAKDLSHTAGAKQTFDAVRSENITRREIGNILE